MIWFSLRYWLVVKTMNEPSDDHRGVKPVMLGRKESWISSPLSTFLAEIFWK
jgi:hypothetical protein